MPKPIDPIRRTLLVSYSLPPALNGSSNIIQNLARQFSADEMILAGEDWPGPEKNLWDDQAGELPSIHLVHRRWPYRFKRVVRFLLLPIIFLRLWRVFRRNKCKQIIAVYPDETFMFLAYVIATLTRTPFYTYFHNTYLENRVGLRRVFAKWLQPAVFRASRIVFVMSEGMREYLAERNPGVRFEPLVHTFNGGVDEQFHTTSATSPFRIAYMGNLNESNSEAMSRLPAIMSELGECELSIYSGQSAAEFAKLGIEGPNITVASVAYDEVTAALRKHEMLVLVHGFTGGLSEVEYETIFPTRTIGYLLSGVPIVAHSPPNSFLTRWLREHDCAEIVDEPSPQLVAAEIKKLASDPLRQTEIIRNGFQAVRMFDAEVVADFLRETVNETCDESSK